MCGIVGYFGKEKDIKIGLSALKRLEYRGYDSAGLAVFNAAKKEIFCLKKAGRIEVLEKEVAKTDLDLKGSPSLFHTRWATHGGVTDFNAHPHSDCFFNTAVSALMILVNELGKRSSLEIRNLKLVIKLLAPFAPHLADELWAQLGEKDSIHNQSWPGYDPKLIREEAFTIVIQINGKVRDKIELSIDLAEKEAKALVLKREIVQKWLAGKKIKKVIFIPQKLINLVI